MEQKVVAILKFGKNGKKRRDKKIERRASIFQFIKNYLPVTFPIHACMHLYPPRRFTPRVTSRMRLYLYVCSGGPLGGL